MSNLSLSIGQYSSRGRKAENQDSYGVLIPEVDLLETKGVVASIADGMSGSEAGKEASESCVKGLFTDYFATPESWTVTTSVEKIVSALNRWLLAQGQSRFGSDQGMVTTFSSLIIKSTTAHIFHIGDSRIYLLRQGCLQQLTRDHRIRSNKDQQYLSRAMGIELNIKLDYKKSAIETGDVFLFTTDGIHDFVCDDDMAEIIASSANLEEAAKDISDRAYANNSDDNLTCQILKVDTLPPHDEESHLKRLQRLPFPPPLEAGMVIDGYRIERELYASKRSEVYLVTDQVTGEAGVLKTLSINYQDDPTFIDLFLREEWIGKRLSSPHILKIIDAPRDKNFLYYVSEYVEGPTLRQWMTDNPTPSLDDVRRIVKQIAIGLRALHRKEMIHQDLKPDNIIIDKHGTVKIIDFGSTKIAGLDEIQTPIEQMDLLGTADYIAPEYHLGMIGAKEADLYSLGVITYEMLTGKLPYGRGFKTRSSIHKLIYSQAYELNSNIPLWVDGAIEQAVQKDRTRRYSTLSEFIKDLDVPNPKYLNKKSQPLLERNPSRFWQAVAIISMLVNIALLAIKLG